MTANRLADEGSPYLRQHADNPVDWQPWDEDALAEARERDDPIFLSVGYSACHWCHVMEDESFQDDGIAELLNEHFVPIKVDREERPDVDTVYQTLCQLKTRRGGWPLSVWLTPDQRPFYVGTYFPPEPKRGQPGFPDVLEQLATAWEDDREEIEERANEWTAQLRRHLGDDGGDGGGASTGAAHRTRGPGADGAGSQEDLLVTAAGQAVEEADDEQGGFGSGGPKFPQARRVEVALRGHDRTGREPYRRVALGALDAWVAGGIHDHVGGGFHRYATDREWVVPHFEKMLYDNAEMPRLLVGGARRAEDEDRAARYRGAVAHALAFLDREMRDPDGGLYATLDAQSAPPDDPEGAHEEGAFYVWTPDEVREAVGDDDLAELFCERYGVTEAGNFEGSTVLTAARTVDALADERGRDAKHVADDLATARERVSAARAERPRPARDEKVIAAWNGLAISTLAEAAWLLGDAAEDAATGDAADPAAMARDALDFVRDELWDADTGDLRRRYKDGDARFDAYLEDYAALCRGALDLHGVTGDVGALAFAIDLARAIEERFWSADDGALYYTQAGAEELVARPQEVADSSTPSSVGVAAEALAMCGAFDPPLEELARDVVAAYRDDAELNPLQHASLCLAADRLAAGSLEITVAGAADGETGDGLGALPDAMRERLGAEPLPGKLVTHRPPAGEIDTALDALGLDEEPAIWADREPESGDATLYVCRDRACSPPTTDVEEALEWVEKLGQ